MTIVSRKTNGGYFLSDGKFLEVPNRITRDNRYKGWCLRYTIDGFFDFLYIIPDSWFGSDYTRSLQEAIVTLEEIDVISKKENINALNFIDKRNDLRKKILSLQLKRFYQFTHMTAQIESDNSLVFNFKPGFNKNYLTLNQLAIYTSKLKMYQLRIDNYRNIITNFEKVNTLVTRKFNQILEFEKTLTKRTTFRMEKLDQPLLQLEPLKEPSLDTKRIDVNKLLMSRW